jgi:hypothetical protein
MNNPKQIILIGNGASVEPQQGKLFERLQTKLSFGMNTRFQVNQKLNLPQTTTLNIVDGTFFRDNRKLGLKEAPLILCYKRREMQEANWNNIIGFDWHYKKIDFSLKTGQVYSPINNMAFSLSLAHYLLREGGTIYTLGLDWGAMSMNKIDKRGRTITHANQELLGHRGVGQTGFTTQKRAEQIFAPFVKTHCKVYNVGLQSKIPSAIFEKISYEQFYNMLDKEENSQEELRKWVREEFKTIPHFEGKIPAIAV